MEEAKKTRKHYKYGVSCGLISLVFLTVIGIVSDINRENPLWSLVCEFMWILIYPVAFIWDSLGVRGCKGMGFIFWILGSFLVHFFIIGFGLGFGLSWLFDLTKGCKTKKLASTSEDKAIL